jgi:hypothetical protein
MITKVFIKSKSKKRRNDNIALLVILAKTGIFDLSYQSVNKTEFLLFWDNVLNTHYKSDLNPLLFYQSTVLQIRGVILSIMVDYVHATTCHVGNHK